MTWREFLGTAKAAMEQELTLRRAQVAAAEDALARIESIHENMIVLESLMASTDSRPVPESGTDQTSNSTTQADPAASPADDPAETVTSSTPAPAAADDPDLTTVTRPLNKNIQRTLQIMASADQPMRAREVVQALGEPDRRSVVEGTRTRLKRLVNSGHLTEHGGLFSIAKRVNGHAQEGVAPADH